MKQHVNGAQLKEIDLDERISLLSLVTGLAKDYVSDEYRKGMKDEDSMLLKYGYDIKVGDLIEMIEDFTGEFPTPEIVSGKYKVKISAADSEFQVSYCDALYEVVKILLKKKIIIVQ
ncbi:hypothetical protein [Candidatus Clostridium radicumherbarum]|uniref:Uncharacterized protein n=1 Tax=Candidatus Clostridium radicumherbarum TaxID=3381662 RepID=A0ABW8TPB6_9CLOT